MSTVRCQYRRRGLPSLWDVRRFILLLAALSGLAACSGIAVMYHRLDWWAERYVDDFVEFNAAQEAQFQRALNRVHVAHCRDDLPQYRARLSEIVERARDGKVDRAYVADLRASLRSDLDRLLALAAPEAVTLLESLSTEQIARLEKGFEKSNADYLKQRAESAEDGFKARRRMMIKRLEHWLGNLTPAQMQSVEEWAAALRADGQMELQTRQRWQGHLIALLDGRKSGLATRDDLYLWLVGFRDARSAEYQALRDQNEAVTMALVADIAASLNQDQLAHLNNEVERWQRRLAAIDCGRVERS